MYKNREGYPAPTEGYALSRIMKEYRSTQREIRKRHESIKHRQKIYIVSKYAGDIKNNVRNAKKYCRFAIANEKMPFAAHLLYPQLLDDADPKERELGLLFGQAWIKWCDEIWVFGNEQSEGMKAEIHEAKKLGKTIRFFDENCKEVSVWRIRKN